MGLPPLVCSPPPFPIVPGIRGGGESSLAQLRCLASTAAVLAIRWEMPPLAGTHAELVDGPLLPASRRRMFVKVSASHTFPTVPGGAHEPAHIRLADDPRRSVLRP